MRRHQACFALISVGERGHQRLVLRLSPVLRKAMVMCDLLITPGNCWRKTTWPALQLSLPPGHGGEKARSACLELAGSKPPTFRSLLQQADGAPRQDNQLFHLRRIKHLIVEGNDDLRCPHLENGPGADHPLAGERLGRTV